MGYALSRVPALRMALNSKYINHDCASVCVLDNTSLLPFLQLVPLTSAEMEHLQTVSTMCGDPLLFVLGFPMR